PHFSSVIVYYSPIFLLMLPRHLSSTLFPYTTLFRSREDRQAHGSTASKARQGQSPRRAQPQTWPHHLLHAQTPEAVRPRTLPGRDRKSTRLNSSHVKISYAVFCLKKKKKNP